MARTFWAVVAMAVMAPAASADVVHLHGGGRIDGEVVAERADAVVVEVAAGRVTLPRHRVERVVRGTSALAEYRARAAALAPRDVGGWLALAAWARDNDLLTQERAALEQVLAVDPGNAAAHRALGHAHVDGRWMTAPEAYQARGYVQFEGQWMRPEERQAVLAERAERAAERRERVEAEARVREAEARARAAEAEARRLEGEERRAENGDGGIPYPYAFGGYGPFGPEVVFPVDPDVVDPPVVVVKSDPSHRGGRRHDGRHDGRRGSSATGGRGAGDARGAKGGLSRGSSRQD